MQKGNVGCILSGRSSGCRRKPERERLVFDNVSRLRIQKLGWGSRRKVVCSKVSMVLDAMIGAVVHVDEREGTREKMSGDTGVG